LPDQAEGVPERRDPVWPPDQALVAKARTAIALHHAKDVVVDFKPDEDGAWYAQAILAPGIAAFGYGETQQAAIDDCNEALDLLIDELRAEVRPDPAGPAAHDRRTKFAM
jgi:predicted RNase H-like HicB family nuclease